jgi:hypothetical protein
MLRRRKRTLRRVSWLQTCRNSIEYVLSRISIPICRVIAISDFLLFAQIVAGLLGRLLPPRNGFAEVYVYRETLKFEERQVVHVCLVCGPLQHLSEPNLPSDPESAISFGIVHLWRSKIQCTDAIAIAIAIAIHCDFPFAPLENNHPAHRRLPDA